MEQVEVELAAILFNAALSYILINRNNGTK